MVTNENAERLTFLKGMAGGSKRHWLLTHREEILEYYRENGTYQTCYYFYMQHATLMALVNNNKQSVEYSPIDRLNDRCDINSEALRELRGQVQDLRKECKMVKEFTSNQITIEIIRIFELGLAARAELESKDTNKRLMIKGR